MSQSNSKINIAIDGYSSCGKSTLARALARKLDYAFIDSGAMYRAITYYFLTHKVDWLQEAEVVKALDHITLSYKKSQNDTLDLYLNDELVEPLIRNMTVANNVSQVAALIPVRRFAVAQQQAMGVDGGIVMDGRDVGTVVFPNAALKIFVTASLTIRAQRRHLELLHKGEDVPIEEVSENLSKRDHIDSTRAEGPLLQADDARVLDTTDLTPDEQLEIAYQWALEILENKK